MGRGVGAACSAWRSSAVFGLDSLGVWPFLAALYSTTLHHAGDLAIRVLECVQLLQISFQNAHHAWDLATRVFEAVQLLQI